MEIRKYQSADCQEVFDLFYDTVHTINAIDHTKEQLDSWVNRNMDLKEFDAALKNSCCYVATVNDVIIGFGDIDVEGHIQHLFAHKDHQGKGVASAILRKLEETADSKIFVNASSTAYGFYERMGYIRVGDKTFSVDDVTFTVHTMEN